MNGLLESLSLTAAGDARDEGGALSSVLKRIPWFSTFSEDDLQGVEAIGRRQSLDEGDYLFREGEPGDSACLILTGSVAVLRKDADNNEILLANLGPGEVIGELAIIDGAARSADVRAREATELFVIPRPDFLTLAAKSPRMLKDLLCGLSHKLRQANDQYYDATIRQNMLRVEQEIDRLRSMGEMVAGLAHEINTPLGIVNHAASLISELLDSVEPDAKDDIRAATRLIRDNLARANRLVGAFKNLSVNQVSDVRTTTSLRGLVDECLSTYSLKARASGLRINVVDRLSAADGQWEGYPGHFSQIMLNLLTNADRYAYTDGAGGEVSITLESDPKFYFVTVQDFGNGVVAEDLPRVFDPFFTTGRQTGGTGLGLSIVRNLVTSSLQGEIHLESVAGSGTKIKLKFPRVCA
jgi:signal transduction histidine kinase